MIGEENTIDFNIEELEFINSLDESSEAPPVDEAGEGEQQEPEGSTGGLEEGQVGSEEETEDNQIEDAAEGESSENVGGSATGEGESEEESSPQLFQAFAETLRESGVLSSVDESSLKDVKGEEDLVKLIQAQIAAQELSDLTEVQKNLVKDVRDGVSTDTANQYKLAMKQLDDVTDDLIKQDQQVRYDLIVQDFIAKGFTREKAAKYANRSVEAGEDLVDATEAKANLVAVVQEQYDRTKQAEIDAAKAEKDKIKASQEALKTKILDTEEFSKGIKVPENVRKEVYKEMTTMVATNPDTKVPENALQKYRRENPDEFDYKLYYLWKLTKGFSDYSYFSNKKVTKTSKKLESALRQSAHVSGGGSPSFTDDGESHLLDLNSADQILGPGEQ